MPAPLTPEKALVDEPYRSIANLLMEFKAGLMLKDIQYAIMKEHYLFHTYKQDKEIKKKIDELLISGKIKKYTNKSIDRHKKKGAKSVKNLTPQGARAETIRNNMRNFLERMRDSRVNIIYKDGKRYKIKDDFIKQSFRMQLIRNLNLWTDEYTQVSLTHHKMKPYYPVGRLLLFGFSDNTIKKMKKKESEDLARYTRNILKNIKKIGDIQQKILNKVFKSWEKNFLKFYSEMKQKNKKIADYLEKLGKDIEKMPYLFFHFLYLNCFLKRLFDLKIPRFKPMTKKEWYDLNELSTALKNKETKWIHPLLPSELNIKDAKFLLDWFYDNINYFHQWFQSSQLTLILFNGMNYEFELDSFLEKISKKIK